MIVVQQCRHGRLMFYDNDIFIGRALMHPCGYSEEEILLWRQIVRPGWSVVEVGANIGAHTVWFANAVGPQGAVLAFEPQRQMYHMMCGNLALNEILNTTVMLAALGDSNGMISVPRMNYRKPGNFGGVSVGGSHEVSEEVPLLMLDMLNLKRVDFIKIDIEGMEAAAIRGAAKTIAAHKPILYVENDRGEHSKELIAIIQGLGYRLFWHLPSINAELFHGAVSVNMLCYHGDMAGNVTGLREIMTPDDESGVVRG